MMKAATLRTLRPFATHTRNRSLLASIDQGTSSSRVILYDETLKPVASHQARRFARARACCFVRSHPPKYLTNSQACLPPTGLEQVELQSATTTPKPGWSQMDPMAILRTVNTSAAGALEKAGAKATDVVGIGVTNQRESTVVWDRVTGKPLYDCVLWHDARTSSTSGMLEAALGGKDALRASCGLPISTYFSGVKLRWLIDNVPEVKAGFEKGTALFGTVDSWLLWNLTGGAQGGAPQLFRASTSAASDPQPTPPIRKSRRAAVGSTTRHVTDVTNASRTMMMGLGTCAWDDSAIDSLGLNMARGALPEIVSSAEIIGRVADGGARALRVGCVLRKGCVCGGGRRWCHAGG